MAWLEPAGWAVRPVCGTQCRRHRSWSTTTASRVWGLAGRFVASPCHGKGRERSERHGGGTTAARDSTAGRSPRKPRARTPGTEGPAGWRPGTRSAGAGGGGPPRVPTPGRPPGRGAMDGARGRRARNDGRPEPPPPKPKLRGAMDGAARLYSGAVWVGNPGWGANLADRREAPPFSRRVSTSEARLIGRRQPNGIAIAFERSEIDRASTREHSNGQA